MIIDRLTALAKALSRLREVVDKRGQDDIVISIKLYPKIMDLPTIHWDNDSSKQRVNLSGDDYT